MLMFKVMYCERCGDVGYVFLRRKCKNCKIKLKLLPEEMKQKYNIFEESWDEIGVKLNTFWHTVDEELNLRKERISRKDNFVMNELINNPVFSMEEYKKQLEKQYEIQKGIAEMNEREFQERYTKHLAAMQKEKDRQNCIPRCPICGSSNIQKITIGTRAVKTAAFGVVGAVDDAGKTYKCRNCDSKF